MTMELRLSSKLNLKLLLVNNIFNKYKKMMKSLALNSVILYILLK